MEIEFQYPLQWIYSQPKTRLRQRARFKTESPYRAGGLLIAELKRMGAKNCIISSNLISRSKGPGFYANQKIDDPGIVIYFELKGKQKAMACDRWDKVEHNLWALYLSIESIRGLERWGGSEFLDGLFTGFTALPAPGDIVVTERNYFSGLSLFDEIESAYKRLAKELHPDCGGDEKEFKIMSNQYRALMKK